MDNFPIQLSENILLEAQLSHDTSSLRRELYYIKDKKLESFLDSDELKNIFWSNIYNAYVLIIAKEAKEETAVFKYKRIKIARHLLSLDDIEFKILGKNNHNPLYKFINNLFSPRFIKSAAVKNVDSSYLIRLDRTALDTSLSVN
tara:strand:+ start:813 stop:1247 length:435 start_codon:yes stop_codon:yes gene_type:complete